MERRSMLQCWEDIQNTHAFWRTMLALSANPKNHKTLLPYNVLYKEADPYPQVLKP